MDFCNERKTFGKTLIQNQYVQFKLANLTSETKKIKVFNTSLHLPY
ncbi:MAG: hypothetical protein H0A76_06790 [Candidatus Thiodubiliella endoseptemdiera]|uniref:Acyl-CoA dehydrogenase/oxidase C-terminal domain-containing protein n=1 Tax=Candidatus Thiodubiliella endoseptemdiera TaxID=2738886 RepID=A0A853F2G8_9GAMM|nr:hypothetical protein [Candidatus Thiodubiliella endoseptemdiera]